VCVCVCVGVCVCVCVCVWCAVHNESHSEQRCILSDYLIIITLASSNNTLPDEGD
jgi:hypothetical protein